MLNKHFCSTVFHITIISFWYRRRRFLCEQSSDRDDRLVVISDCRYCHSVLLVHRVYDLIVADVNADVAVVADQVAWACVFKGADFDSVVSLCMGIVRKTYSEMLVYGKCKS